MSSKLKSDKCPICDGTDSIMKSVNLKCEIAPHLSGKYILCEECIEEAGSKSAAKESAIMTLENNFFAHED